MNRRIELLNEECHGIVVTRNNVLIKYSDLSLFDKYIFYITKNLNGPLFTMLSGLITSLSVNLLSSFIDIEVSAGYKIVLFSITKLICCLVFNFAFVLFTIALMNINNSISIPSDIIPKDQHRSKLEQYLVYYSEQKSYINICFCFSIVFGVLTILAIILSPFFNYYFAS